MLISKAFKDCVPKCYQKRVDHVTDAVLRNHIVVTVICYIANFPWLAPFFRFFGRQSSFGLSWRYMEATAKKIVSERRSRGIGGKVQFMIKCIPG